jgi:hypothetical protein
MRPVTHIRSLAPALTLAACAALAVLAAPPAPTPAQSAAKSDATPSPQRVLGLIRAQFRSHRPPPPFVSYTLVRTQKTADGYPDPVGSYSDEIWCRTSDRAALARRVFRFPDFGPLTFQRPEFNEDRDPGPPTADLFEPAPAHPRPIEFVPTPEPTQDALRVIGSVKVSNEFDYKVTALDVEGNLVHLTLVPYRDPDRNRLRELWADRTTYELRKLVATDTLYIEGGPEYAVTFTVYLGTLDGLPVVTNIHGVAGGMISPGPSRKRGQSTPAPGETQAPGPEYDGDGKTIDYVFKNIKFPPSLPAWYFDPHTYAAHVNDAPS